MAGEGGDLGKRVCEELFWLWKTVDFAKQELREMQDRRLILPEDFAEMMEALDRAEKTVWGLKRKYKCMG